MNLSTIVDEPTFAAGYADTARWQLVIERIAARHRLSGPVHRFPTGSAIVFAVGQWVVKLFPPFWSDDHRRESSCLRVLDGALGIPTPPLEASGELEGWPYFVVGRVAGLPIDGQWPALGTASSPASVWKDSVSPAARAPGILDSSAERICSK